MSQLNRMHNAGNPHQGDFKKVLCVCSAGLLRSPTAALVLSQDPFNFNTRAAGIEESYALVPVDLVLMSWADEVVVMTQQHRDMLLSRFPQLEMTGQSVKVLGISDDYPYRDPDLMRLIAEKYVALN